MQRPILTARSSKPKTLFMRTSSKNHEAAKGAAAFDDVSKGVTKKPATNPNEA